MTIAVCYISVRRIEEATKIGFLFGGHVELEYKPEVFDFCFRLTKPPASTGLFQPDPYHPKWNPAIRLSETGHHALSPPPLQPGHLIDHARLVLGIDLEHDGDQALARFRIIGDTLGYWKCASFDDVVAELQARRAVAA